MPRTRKRSYFAAICPCLVAMTLVLTPFDSSRADLLDVIIAPVTESRISDPIEALGTLRARESVDLTATITETISEIRFDDGQRVEAGAILVTLTNREQLAELSEAEAQLEEARRQFERVEDLASRGQESRAILDQRQRELAITQARVLGVQARLGDRLIRAPFDGIVGLRNVSVGSLLTPGSLITTLHDDSLMKLDFAIPEVFLAQVEAGLTVRAGTRAYPGEVFEGKVSSTGNAVDPVSRAFMVRAEIANPEKRLRPGMLMSVTLESRERYSLSVPEEAVLSSGRSHHVFVIDSTSSTPESDQVAVRRQSVELGSRLPGTVEILDGLSEGQRVVVHGGFRLGDGDTVRVRAEVDDQQSLAAILSNGDDS